MNSELRDLSFNPTTATQRIRLAAFHDARLAEVPVPTQAPAASPRDRQAAGRHMALPAWKRGLDLALIAVALPLLLPLAGLLAAWVKALGGQGRVLFCQKRVGHGGRTFTIYKFRSMKENASTRDHENHVRDLMTSGRPLTKMDNLGDQRLIPGASLLRNSGLDEIPQLLNVLRGDMSLVGPRPCLPEEYELYSEAERERFEAVPGLTGYWQVNGKNRTTFAEMVALDVHYARHKTLWMDLGVVARTPIAIAGQFLKTNGAGESPTEARKRRLARAFRQERKDRVRRS